MKFHKQMNIIEKVIFFDKNKPIQITNGDESLSILIYALVAWHFNPKSGI